MTSLPAFVLRRLGYGLFVLLGLSMLIFVIARVVPGDPALLALGPRAPKYALESMRKEMNLDKPIYTQYGLWLKGVVTKGDLGLSTATRRPVQEDIGEFLPATLELVLLSALIMAVGGILMGLWSAAFRDRWPDTLGRVTSYVLIATPQFVWLVVMILLFGYIWQIFPTVGRVSPGVELPPTITGMVTIDSLVTGNWGAFSNAMAHLLLPSLALATGGAAQAARITRSSIIDHMDSDHTVLMTAFGVPRRQVMGKYLLKLSLIPTVSILGLDIASLFAWAFVCETVINYPGLSRYGMQAILNKDLNAIVGTIMVLGCVFVLVTIVIDIVVAYLDPRIRLRTRA